MRKGFNSGGWRAAIQGEGGKEGQRTQEIILLYLSEITYNI